MVDDLNYKPTLLEKIQIKFYLWAIKRTLIMGETILDNARKSISNEAIYGRK